MTYKEKQELNALSKEAFGRSSKWQKLVDEGITEPMEREREVMVPSSSGGLEKKVFLDKKTVLRRYSVEEVRSLMLEILSQRKVLPSDNLEPAKE